jgi:CubicO group peptidase (beta-lactamase class C family)
MAKLGYLFLNGGTWKGERIVSQEWIEESTKGHVSPSWLDGYGYQWWRQTYQSNSTSVDSFLAAGWGGQRIINYVGEEPVDDIITRYILPAVR